MGAVDGHPALDLLEVVEHPLAVDEQVADHGELSHRRELDVVLAGLGQLLVGQAAAALPHLAVDDHGTPCIKCRGRILSTVWFHRGAWINFID